MTGAERRERLARAQLYLCAPIRDDGFLEAVLGAGVDVVQLRDKQAGDAALARAAERFRAAADRHGALFVVNDRADVAAVAGADGVHLGQDDLRPAEARAILGPGALVGRSTHAVAELAAALREPLDYLGVGPVHATPTKQGRPGVGLDYVREAAARAGDVPWFVTGGMNAETIPVAVDAGARRFVVVRAITGAPDPARAVAAIRAVLPPLDA
ncbi:MAG TPA: thiamine phosphate synthase [Actinomycetota bacterium]